MHGLQPHAELQNFLGEEKNGTTGNARGSKGISLVNTDSIKAFLCHTASKLPPCICNKACLREKYLAQNIWALILRLDTPLLLLDIPRQH